VVDLPNVFIAMKHTIVAIYTNFRTSIHDHGDMEIGDGYLAGPKERRLELKFRRAE